MNTTKSTKATLTIIYSDQSKITVMLEVNEPEVIAIATFMQIARGYLSVSSAVAAQLYDENNKRIAYYSR